MRLTNRLAMSVVICVIVALGISTTLSPTPGVLDARAQSSDEISMTDILDAILDGGTSTSGDLDPVAQAAQIYHNATFESNDGSYTLTGLWHRSTDCSTTTAGAGHTTTGTLRAGDMAVAPGACDYLSVVSRTDTADSGTIDLTAASIPVVLTFNYFLNTDGAGTGDIASVFLSTDSGVTFPTLVADNASSPVALADNATWTSVSVTLPAAAAGSTIAIRFQFAMDATNGAGEGFYIDDVVVTADDGATAGGGAAGAGPCFIATAAYGTPLAKDIDALRAVRDTYLLNNVLGAAFVDSYYRSSPVIADWVSRYPVVASGVRMVLAPVIALSRFALNAPLAFSLLLLVMGATALRIRSRKNAEAA